MEPVALWRRARAAMLLAVAVTLFASCTVSKNPITGNKRAYGYTWAQEVQIGKEADPQIVAQFGLYEDADLTSYVERIGEKVLAESHLRRPDTDPEFRNTPFTFRVLDSPVVNAFALPGGYVYVTRGLLTHLDNEAQLAVVLGHEVGHVAARHASKRAATQQLGQLGLIGGAILGQQVLGGSAGQNILDLGGTAAQLLFLSYGRDDERESDDLGVEYAAKAGYKASEAAEFFRSLKRISDESGQSIPSFLSTHPDPGEREQKIPRLAQEWAPLQPDEVGQQDFMSRLEGTVLGENPRQGFTRGGVFYHPDLRFRFPVPNGYQVINQPTQVAMIEPNQQAILVLQLAQGARSARDAAAELTGQQGITIVESGNTTVSGYPAYAVVGDAQTQQGVIRFLSYYIEYGGLVYNFLGYAARDNFASYNGAFLQAVRGFSQLTDRSILNIEPHRVRIVAASRTAPFREFVPANLPEQFTAEELAILNQVTLDEVIQRGQPLKLPN
ncbi:MAG: M48 family metalloprotease [Rhodothermales bacterium]|nr:M48 family metalloprotease [Rhodothermales bacterium]